MLVQLLQAMQCDVRSGNLRCKGRTLSYIDMEPKRLHSVVCCVSVGYRMNGLQVLKCCCVMRVGDSLNVLSHFLPHKYALLHPDTKNVFSIRCVVCIPQYLATFQ
jgi:hypothetical protein